MLQRIQLSSAQNLQQNLHDLDAFAAWWHNFNLRARPVTRERLTLVIIIFLSCWGLFILAGIGEVHHSVPASQLY